MTLIDEYIQNPTHLMTELFEATCGDTERPMVATFDVEMVTCGSCLIHEGVRLRGF